jgi:hypothetical protein
MNIEQLKVNLRTHFDVWLSLTLLLALMLMVRLVSSPELLLWLAFLLLVACLLACLLGAKKKHVLGTGNHSSIYARHEMRNHRNYTFEWPSFKILVGVQAKSRGILGSGWKSVGVVVEGKPWSLSGLPVVLARSTWCRLACTLHPFASVAMRFISGRASIVFHPPFTSLSSSRVLVARSLALFDSGLGPIQYMH